MGFFPKRKSEGDSQLTSSDRSRLRLGEIYFLSTCKLPIYRTAGSSVNRDWECWHLVTTNLSQTTFPAFLEVFLSKLTERKIADLLFR